MLPFVPFYEGRLQEIKEVIEFLDRNDVDRDYDDCNVPCEVFSKIFCVAVKSPSGKGLVVPLQRSLRVAQDRVYPIMVHQGQLRDRRAVHGRQANPEYSFDLFISHAHLDNDFAHSLAQWLSGLWPQLKITLTKKAGSEDAFQANPTYFFEELEKSRFVLYCATPNSLHRTMVDLEIASRVDKTVITLLCGGATLEDLSDKIGKDLFLNLDTDKIVEVKTSSDWERLVEMLVDVLSLSIPRSPMATPEGSVVVAEGAKSPSSVESYIEDHSTITEAVHRRQTVGEADKLLMQYILDGISQGGGDRERMKALIESFPAHQKLLIYLQRGDNPTVWFNMLDLFPALLDAELLSNIAMLISAAEESDDVERLLGIRDVVVELLSLVQMSCPYQKLDSVGSSVSRRGIPCSWSDEQRC